MQHALQARHALPALAALSVLALLAPAASAADTPVLEALTAASPDNGRALIAVNAHLGCLDGDNDRVCESDEPAYMDLDASSGVSVGDLRITAFDTYPAGTEVAVTNRDAGRALFRVPGWFGQSSNGWYADLDGSRTVSEADIRLDTAPQRVAAHTAERGQPLAYPSVALLAGMVAVDDADRDGARDRGEAAYLDLDTSTRSGPPIAGPGDLRFQVQGPGLDGAPTRAEFDQATGRTSTGSGGAGSTGGVTAIDGDSDEGKSAGGSSWGMPETLLLLLGIVNLVGLVALYRRNSRPKNPFK